MGAVPRPETNPAASISCLAMAAQVLQQHAGGDDLQPRAGGRIGIRMWRQGSASPLGRAYSGVEPGFVSSRSESQKKQHLLKERVYLKLINKTRRRYTLKQQLYYQTSSIGVWEQGSNAYGCALTKRSRRGFTFIASLGLGIN